MKCLYVVDKYGSALWNAAMARCTLGTGLVITADEFKSPKILLKFIVESEYDYVFFSWRKSLYDISRIRNSGKLLTNLYITKVILLLIPDYLGLDDKNFQKESQILNLCHQYFTTNSDLATRYAKKFPNHSKPKILHDLPRFDLIEEIITNYPKQESHKTKKVIWIGNSRWGERQGYKDYKGYESVILPLKKLFENHSNCFNLQIIDSAEKSMSHLETLIKIRQSDYLIQVSVSEGTGLPVLEAISLGTNVLTTNVGIAQEIFDSRTSLNIVSRDAVFIHNRLHELEKENLLTSTDLIYRQYIKKIINESLEPQNKNMKASITIPNNQCRFTIITNLYWFLRFCVAKIMHKKDLKTQ
jgi:glycosyltransferase involved in cell wall biosynthesis